MTLILGGVHCYYGGAHVLRGVSLVMPSGQVLCLLGRNGAGKTTTLKAIMGLVTPVSGSIQFDGRELTKLPPHDISRFGVAYVPQGRRLFPFLTVEENLRMGLLVKTNGDNTLEWVLSLFPALKERFRQRAGTLSGGEQQIVATARALCADPKLLLMDEPTEGLMPILTQKLLEIIRVLKSRNVGVLLVEQKLEAALKVADRVTLMENGQIRHQSTAGELAANTELLVRYLGVRR